MFDFDMPELDLGSRRRQPEWVSVDSSRPCQKLHKQRRRHRQREKKAAQAAATAAAAAGLQPHSCVASPAAAQPLSAATITPAQAKHNKEYRDSGVVCLSTEIENGNVEYKYCLSGCISNPNRRHQLVTQMKYRLSEGGGECFYYIGVEDDGYPRGLDSKELAASSGIIASMAASLAATARLVEYVRGGFGRLAALMHIKADAEEGMSATDLRVAVAGNMDSGKSTLVAVLTHGSDGRPLLDNCRGSARMAVFRHKHEIESGRTSSISQQVLGYDEEGRVLNYVGVSAPTPADITGAASRVLTFIDMGGHEKYLKTTLYGMTCTLPDYVLLCIDALCGVTRITREHLAVAVALEVPTALVITKADAADAHQLQSVLQQLRQLMAPLLGNAQQQQPASLTGQASCQEQGETPPPPASTAATGLVGTEVAAPVAAECADGVPVVLSEPQAVRLADSLSELHSCTAAAAASFRQVTFPVFTVSCVTGAGLSLLHAFLSSLRPVSTNRSSRQCSAALVQSAVGDAAAVPAGLSADGVAAPEPTMQQQRQQPASSSIAPWQDSSQPAPSDKCGDAVDVQRQLLDMEGSSSLWVTKQLTAEVVMPVVGSGSSTAGAGMAAADAAAGAAGAGGAAAAAAAAAAGHFQVVATYDVEGVGWVVSGIAVSGTIDVGQSLLWGPTSDGGFSPVRVSCIQRSHVPVKQVQPGQTATLALQPAGPGTVSITSKQALLSAAQAAQAAAEAAAAREAAAAVEAAPNSSYGKPQAQHSLVRESCSVLPPAATSAAAAAAVGAGAGCCVVDDDAAFDMLADDLAAELALDDDDEDDEGNDDDMSSGSEFALGSFGCLDDDVTTSSNLSASASFSSRADSSHQAALAAAAAIAGTADGKRTLPKSKLGAAAGTTGGTGQLGRGLEACFSGSSSAGSSSSSTSLEFSWDLGGTDEPAALEPVAAAAAAAAAAGPGPAGSAAAARNLASHTAGQRQPSLGSSRSSFGAIVGLPGSSASCSSASLGSMLAASPMPAADAEAAAHTGGWPVASAARGARMDHPPASASCTLGCSPSNWRSKGAVLLGASAAAKTYWEFEALLVLLGGHWPARGLLSGCWPPAEQLESAASTQLQQQPAPDPAAAAAAGIEWASEGLIAGTTVEQDAAATPAAEAGGDVARGGVRRRPGKQQQRCKQYEYAYVIHCNSIRQIARVVHMRELRDEQQQQQQQHAGTPVDSLSSSSSGPSAHSSGNLGGCRVVTGALSSQQPPLQLQHSAGLSASIQAAAALLQADGGSGCGAESGSSSGDRAGGGGSSSRHVRGRRRPAPGDLGTVVAVQFRFTHRPEWMQVGARMIVRDRSDGHVAAAGFVTALLDPHIQKQQQGL